MVLEIVDLLVVEFLGVYGCDGVNIVFLSQSDEGEVGLEAGGPVVECGDWYLDLVLALHSGLGLGEGVAEVEVGEGLEDERSGVLGAREGVI